MSKIKNSMDFEFVNIWAGVIVPGKIIRSGSAVVIVSDVNSDGVLPSDVHPVNLVSQAVDQVCGHLGLSLDAPDLIGNSLSGHLYREI